MAKQPRENPKHMTKIGGQALIEGVMMKGADTGAMACRLPNGEIDVETWAENNGKNMPWYRKCPFVRGSFNFVLSMKDGYRCLTKSAEKQVPEDEEDDTEEMNRFEKWLDEKLGDKLFGRNTNRPMATAMPTIMPMVCLCSCRNSSSDS